MDLAAHRIAECSEAFCLKHAIICERNGHVAGMMLGYRLSGHGATPELGALCTTLRPHSDLAGPTQGGFYMNTLALYPAERKQGLGTVLLAAAERKARAAGCTCMLLEVARDNIAAVRFYRRFGYSLWPGVVSTATGGTPFLVLEKRL